MTDRPHCESFYIPGKNVDLLISGSTGFVKGEKNQATIFDTDILAFNGLVHVIDAVLFPPESNDPDQVPTEIPNQAPTLTPVDPSTPLPPANFKPFCESVNLLGDNGPRIGGSFTGSTCGFPPVYPGSVGEEPRYFSKIGPFVNASPDPSCITVDIDPGTCVSDAGFPLIHTTAFTDFDPSNSGDGYLGDVGVMDAILIFISSSGQCRVLHCCATDSVNSRHGQRNGVRIFGDCERYYLPVLVMGVSSRISIHGHTLLYF